MSDFDVKLNRTLFDSITGALEFDDQILSAADMHQVLVGGEPMLLDAFAGDDLKSQLLKVVDDAQTLLGVSANSPQIDRQAQIPYISEALGDELSSFFEQRQGTGLLALKGVNVFLATDISERREGENIVCSRNLLQSDEVLLGNLYGIMYGKFSWAKQRTIAKGFESGMIPKLSRKWGGVLQLTDVKVCDSEGIGHVDRTYASAFVPVHKKVFNWYIEAQ